MLKKVNAMGGLRLFIVCATTAGLCGYTRHADTRSAGWVPVRVVGAESKQLRAAQLEQLKIFSQAKEQQSLALAKIAGEEVSPDVENYFSAASSGDWKTVEKMFADYAHRSPQYANSARNANFRPSYWGPILEVDLAYECVIPMEPQTVALADEIINSIPAGSIYFGGTDPGRGLITAFSKSHADGDPFFTLTQNALADGTYLNYVRNMYGRAKIQIPSAADSARNFRIIAPMRKSASNTINILPAKRGKSSRART